MADRELGVVVRGSLAQGVELKLAEACSVEDLRAGRFVVVHGDKFYFFSMITNVRLDSSSQQLLLNPPAASQAVERRILTGSSV